MTNCLDRRTLLRVAGASAGTAVLAGATLATGSSAHAASGLFRHGVASGDPLADRVLLWTRLTPTEQAQPGSGVGPEALVSWQVSADPDFAAVVAQGTFVTGPARDHTVRVDARGLSPATTYWYRFGYDGAWSPIGRTMTAPAVNAEIDRLRLGVVSCANWEGGYFAAYRYLAERGDLNLVVHLGDYLYEYGTGQLGTAGKVIRPVSPPHETLTLADYRIRHATYKTDPDLQALHAAVPWAITWDDHECANNQWSGGAENHTPGTEGDFAVRLAAARQAYQEWMPVRLGADGAIYRRLRFGRLVDLSMLDLRTYRSKPTRGTGVDDPNRTITGDDQMAWLKSGLAASAARWKLVGSSVMISRLDVGALPAWLLGPLGELMGVPDNGLVLNTDQWDGYNADRNELVDHLRATGTHDVVFLTGDIHTSWANEVTTKATGPWSPAAAEFVVPSVTTDNVDDFLRLPADNVVSKLGAGLLRATNPHVRWTELDGHGYGVLDVTKQQCRMDWYHLADRTKRVTSSRWVAGWSVAAGSAKLHKESSPLV
ncbi:alkaline phosphatase D family protein [Micromonospora sp. WMMA1363]|uniref:alkaline phosphatase D family protein n=1 Tax=Micromonospora sp. WMMA1363 TaxID=3053985 RepID=UPI00259C8198|nr:alkaline phosphatase D family protein [Micromonospora sp. WMMA1363]MDM4719358.1 alkaline phosphatase D family protein [Micromonospora sp. WMMA1363]